MSAPWRALYYAVSGTKVGINPSLRLENKREITARAISLLLVDHLGLEPRTDRL